jgi:CheY-like chemotaxis protein
MLSVNGLKQSGFSVDCAADGEQALTHFRTVAYDAAVPDLMLPKLDGLSVLGVRREKAALFPVGASPTRQVFQQEATGATVEVTKRLKAFGKRISRIGDSASVQAATRVNAERASKRTMRGPTRKPYRGRLIRLGDKRRRRAMFANARTLRLPPCSNDALTIQRRFTCTWAAELSDLFFSFASSFG